MTLGTGQQVLHLREECDLAAARLRQIGKGRAG